MPDKVTISHRGAKYEIGRGKRCYGIWVAGAPASDPIDRWPETPDGWAQAWARFVAIETPGTITAVQTPRAGFRLPARKRTDNPDTPAAERGGGTVPGTVAMAVGRPRKAVPTRAMAGAWLLGLGVVLGLIGLFPGYIGSQSLASQADDLVPHLFYLVAWAASAALVATGAARARQATGRLEPLRLGAMLGTGLSAVTLGLFVADLGEVIAGGSSLLGAGLVLSLLGWLACAAGSLLALSARPRTAPPAGAQGAGAAPSPASVLPASVPLPGQPSSGVPQPEPAYLAGPPFAADPSSAQERRRAYPAGPGYATGPAYAAAPKRWLGRTVAGGPVLPRLAEAGPIALVVLAAIGTVAAFAPSWDSYTIIQAATGTSQSFTLGNAFANPGPVIAGNVIVMIAIVAIAALAALWRPARQGAMLLAGATVPLVAQAISALIQISQPVTPAQFGISQAQASALGVSITSGVTPIFWVYCVFVISLVVSCAWMLTAPPYPAMPAAPRAAEPEPRQPFTGMDDEDTDTDDDAEDGAESTFA